MTPLTNKTWRFIGVGYLVLCAVTVGIEWHGKARGAMSAMDKLLVVPAAFGFAVHGIQLGYVRGRFSTVDRSTSPLTFWLNITVYLLIGLGFLYLGVRHSLK